mmetsp:Transcript_132806/g.335400  ORF Transcript_132806/g.335400 Transcript_132806/m.335400 type:complete len:209 (+) Transcript_132806:223-849(+)
MQVASARHQDEFLVTWAIKRKLVQPGVDVSGQPNIFNMTLAEPPQQFEQCKLVYPNRHANVAEQLQDIGIAWHPSHVGQVTTPEAMKYVVDKHLFQHNVLLSPTHWQLPEPAPTHAPLALVNITAYAVSSQAKKLAEVSQGGLGSNSPMPEGTRRQDRSQLHSDLHTSLHIPARRINCLAPQAAAQEDFPAKVPIPTIRFEQRWSDVL